MPLRSMGGRSRREKAGGGAGRGPRACSASVALAMAAGGARSRPGRASDAAAADASPAAAAPVLAGGTARSTVSIRNWRRRRGEEGLLLQEPVQPPPAPHALVPHLRPLQRVAVGHLREDDRGERQQHALGGAGGGRARCQDPSCPTPIINLISPPHPHTCTVSREAGSARTASHASPYARRCVTSLWYLWRSGAAEADVGGGGAVAAPSSSELSASTAAAAAAAAAAAGAGVPATHAAMGSA